MSLILQVICAFLFKHIMADYFLNPIYTPANKHKYGSKGSLLHMFCHMFFCFFFLFFLVPGKILVFIVLFDGLVHYHVDFVKSRLLCQRECLSQWVVLMIILGDQILHLLTYVFLTVAFI